jgi:4'-phosphopantetheinyl transferase
VEDARLEQCLSVLGRDEHERALKFAFPYLRQRYIAAHGILRLILGSVLNRDARDLQFEFGEHGKPYLVGGGLHFNLSHSEEQGMLAVTPLGEIGVDIESMERKVEIRGIAERFFSDRESTELFELDSATD